MNILLERAALRSSDKKVLLFKATKFLAKKLEALNRDGWTDLELSKELYISNTRLSEIKNYKNYNKPVAEKHLILMIEKGIVTMNELKLNVASTEKEQAYFDTMTIYEDNEHRELYLEIKKLGLNPADILKEYLKNNTA